MTDYDCRIFAATGVTLDEKVQAGISAQAKAWRFTYAGEAVDTARFLPVWRTPDPPSRVEDRLSPAAFERRHFERLTSVQLTRGN